MKTKKTRKSILKITTSLPKLCGFDLLIGQKYQEGWFREFEPALITDHLCPQCDKNICMSWPLHRQIQAFGNIIIQHLSIIQCLSCKHEWEVTITPPFKYKPQRRIQLTTFQLEALIRLAKEKGLI